MDLHRTPIRDQDLRKVAAAFPRVVDVDLSFCKVSVSADTAAFGCENFDGRRRGR